MTNRPAEQTRRFEITVLGRTLEHLGTQMYKRRDVALAELVANAWDAGATVVAITVPTGDKYDVSHSSVKVADNGTGMTPDEVDDNYLVIGRNRRVAGQLPPNSRRVMGRKGVGKLAGFGFGKTMAVTTWRDGLATTFDLEGASLKAEGGETKRLIIPGTIGKIPEGTPWSSGTEIEIRTLKHKTPPNIDALHRSLARRFSRAVLGEMQISINDEPLRELDLQLAFRTPDEDVEEITLSNGQVISYWAGFSKTVLPTELQGFTVLVHGKTAQAPPYFFGVEGTASGQHGTKYLTGVVEADYLDDDSDDESDRISTDRQEVDWDDEATAELKAWGEAITRKLLRERSEKRGVLAEESVLEDHGLATRLAALDSPSRRQATSFIRALGKAETQPERVKPLADTILRAFEYRHFHDYIEELEAAIADPLELNTALEHLHGWKVLESRAILEVVKGRIEIVEKFFEMIVNDISETAHLVGNDNMHDLIASYPWLINPEWQVLAEEKTITRQLRDWGLADTGAQDSTRYDFLALAGDGEFVVIEIKRSGHAVNMSDLQQLERYVEKLGRARDQVRGVFVTGSNYDLREQTLKNWKERDDIELLTWKEIHRRTSEHYNHYKAILDSDLSSANFDRKIREVALTRSVLSTGTYRSIEERRGGIGPQDAQYE